MKKVILIAVMVVVLIAVAGCTAENPTVVEEVDEGMIEEANEEHEHEHDHSVEIEGSEMKALSVQEVAALWEIDSEVLLSKIIAEFDLQKEYDINTTLEEIRQAEYKFSPAIIKDLAEEAKSQT